MTLECTSTNPAGTSTATFSEAEEFHNPETPTPDTLVHAPMEQADSETSSASTCAAEALSMEHNDTETQPQATPTSDTLEHNDNETTTCPADVEQSCTANTAHDLDDLCTINLNSDENHQGLKTSVGNSIKRLLRLDDDLIKFDDLRFRLKAARKAGNHVHMKTSISEYNKLVAKFKTKISLVKSDLVANIKEVELKQFQTNGKLPAKTSGSHYYNLLKERNVASAILRTI